VAQAFNMLIANSRFKKLLKIFAILLIVVTVIFFGYCNNTRLANKQTVAFYQQLKDSLKARGYSTSLLVISTKRFTWHNWIQVWLSGASRKSKHVDGDAIDFLVFDINRDGSANKEDIDIVYNLLDKEIIRDKGGIGTYKTDKHIMNRKMVHIDCRGGRTRWHR